MESASPDNPELARFLDRQAMALLEEKDLKGAQRIYERSLALRQKALGPENPEVAESLSGLAYCASQVDRFKEAEALYERALTLVRKPDGSYYPSAYDVLKGFASFLRATHRDARAVELEAQVKSMEIK
jgi:tetratricopeptide (TPR) repeat protein